MRFEKRCQRQVKRRASVSRDWFILVNDKYNQLI